MHYYSYYDIDFLTVKKSKKFVSCGRRTTFDYDDSGSIICPAANIDGDGTSGDDDSDDSDAEGDNDAEMKTKAVEKTSLEIEKDTSKTMTKRDKDVLKHNKDAKAISTGSVITPVSDVAKPAGGGARKGKRQLEMKQI